MTQNVQQEYIIYNSLIADVMPNVRLRLQLLSDVVKRILQRSENIDVFFFSIIQMRSSLGIAISEKELIK